MHILSASALRVSSRSLPYAGIRARADAGRMCIWTLVSLSLSQGRSGFTQVLGWRPRRMTRPRPTAKRSNLGRRPLAHQVPYAGYVQTAIPIASPHLPPYKHMVCQPRAFLSCRSSPAENCLGQVSTGLTTCGSSKASSPPCLVRVAQIWRHRQQTSPLGVEPKTFGL